MATIQTTVGPGNTADGGIIDIRSSRVGALITSDGHGQRREAVSRSRVYVASTAAAGVAPGTVLSTTPPFSLWCPTGASVKLSVLEVRVSYVSGTIGTGTLVYARVPAQVAQPTTGTVLTPTKALLDGTQTAVGVATQGSTHVATPTLVEAVGGLTPALATSVLNPLVITQDFLNGKYEVPAGNAFVIQAIAAAGTSPLFMFGVTWEEIPV